LGIGLRIELVMGYEEVRVMKWIRVCGVVVGLVAGVLWIVFGISRALGSRMMVIIFPVVLQSLVVGFAVVASSLIALRWHVVGGILLLLEGVAPVMLLFLMAAGYPLFFTVVSALTLVAGILCLLPGSKA
jgi:hypothetical protein